MVAQPEIADFAIPSNERYDFHVVPGTSYKRKSGDAQYAQEEGINGAGHAIE